ncbi:MAG: translation initiation factor IF-2 [Deltaproteobacteria bacterium]|nr:translation initiation factor IF-2 [Deltaproteobacteria bacterium]
MDEQKTEIVERRLSRGVIRRRARPTPAESEPQAAPAPKKETIRAAVTESAPKTEPVVKKEPVVNKEAVVKKETAVSIDDPVKTAPVAEEVVGKAKDLKITAQPLVLDKGQQEIARENILKNLGRKKPQKEKEKEAQEGAELPPPVKEVKEKTDDEFIKEHVIIRKPKGEEEEKKVEKPKVLSFKDRIKGTIDLNQFKPQKAKEKEAGQQASPAAAGVAAPHVYDDKEEVEKNKPEKAARLKKGVKNIGGDLDIEGQGRATHLSQLRALTLDRVFRPGVTIKGRGRKKKILARKGLKATAITTKKLSKRIIAVDQTITISRLAQELGIKAGGIIKQLMDLGMMVTINQEIDRETATLIASEHQYEVRDVSFKESSLINTAAIEGDADSGQVTRPPVVTVMGHVDHGKTSILDAIRSTNVTQGEAGGITQHIGAYTVTLPQGAITFIDTPGHEAFTTMRSRGAQVTDIVVLVVAADDGVMPQTIESINHARAAGVPLIVAINKMDKPEANPDVIKRQLSEHGLLAEDWGGETIFNQVSAKTGAGLEALLESIILQAEVLELSANAENRGEGVVLESKLDRARGPLSTLLVRSGTVRVGDFIVAGSEAGKIRVMNDWTGKPLTEAGPSAAVEVLGLEGVPLAGDTFNIVGSDQDAHKVAGFRFDHKKKQEQTTKGGMTLEDMFSQMKAGEISALNLIIKTDVQGSLEAVCEAVSKIGNAEVKSKIVHSAVGGINESDVSLALTSKAVIIGFNVRPEIKAIHYAKENNVDIKLYKVIYDLVNDVKLAMEGLLAPDIKEEYLGRAEVRQAFEVSKLGTVAGSMVVDGVITRTAHIRFLRDNVVMHEGKITSLKRFKDDAREVKQGFECGIGIENYKDIKANDVIEAFNLIEVKKTL